MIKSVCVTLLSALLISCSGNADLLKVGNTAPEFSLEDHSGNLYSLSDYRGKFPVVVYFYPKASTPGCTKQACGIRDEYSKFNDLGIKVFGISVDSKEAIKEFVEENSLNFPLLSDASKEVAKKYGVLNNMGMASRITFIIDKDGKVAKIIKDVDVNSHSYDVLKIAEELI